MKMTGYLRTAAVLITITALFFTVEWSLAASKKYTNNYKGIYTGISTIDDMYREMGQPVRLKKAGKGKNYRYKKVIINFPGMKNPKVNTIIIDKDYNYLDENGFKIGSSIKKVRGKLGNGSKNTISDKKNGIIYWHDGKRVKRIVLVKSLKITSKKNPRKNQAYASTSKIYKWKDEKGKWHYSNVIGQ